MKSVKLNLAKCLGNIFPFLKFLLLSVFCERDGFHEIFTQVYHVILFECEQGKYKVVRIAFN